MALHVTPDTEQRLEHLAALENQTSNHLAQELVNRFLDHREQLTAAVERGREAVRRGDLHDNDEVMSMLDHIIEG